MIPMGDVVTSDGRVIVTKLSLPNRIDWTAERCQAFVYKWVL